MDASKWEKLTVEAGYWTLKHIEETKHKIQGEITSQKGDRFLIWYPKDKANVIEKVWQLKNVWVENIVEFKEDGMRVIDIYLKPYRSETVISIVDSNKRATIKCTNSQAIPFLIEEIIKIKNWYEHSSKSKIHFTLGRKFYYDLKLYPYLPSKEKTIAIGEYEISDYFQSAAVVVSLAINGIKTFEDLRKCSEDDLKELLEPSLCKQVMDGCERLKFELKPDK